MKDAGKILQEASELFKKKNEEYKDNWKETANVLDALFPDGLYLSDTDDFTRFQFLVMMAGKLTRYCNNYDKGGHKDSIRDLIVYCALLEAADGWIEDLDKFEDKMEELSDKIANDDYLAPGEKIVDPALQNKFLKADKESFSEFAKFHEKVDSRIPIRPIHFSTRAFDLRDELRRGLLGTPENIGDLK